MELVNYMRAFFYSTAFAAAALAACNPYSPDLGQTPFKCGAMSPQCPGGYECVAGFCEDTGGDTPDGHTGPPDGSCGDLAEPNNMINAAYPSPVWAGGLDHIQYEGLTLCPAMDGDYFSIIQPVTCGAAPACPNLSVLAEFEDTGNPPTVAILNSTGTVVAPGGSTGTAGQVKAILNNVAQGTYYARITSSSTLSHYLLTIDGSI